MISQAVLVCWEDVFSPMPGSLAAPPGVGIPSLTASLLSLQAFLGTASLSAGPTLQYDRALALHAVAARQRRGCDQSGCGMDLFLSLNAWTSASLSM